MTQVDLFIFQSKIFLIFLIELLNPHPCIMNLKTPDDNHEYAFDFFTDEFTGDTMADFFLRKSFPGVVS